ncbi:hypothetical protein [Streptomyces sp. NPDC056672]|uniref:hypothetical protein n=1 Tax=Streptomyces sp. NPDC056672 TaxID=3345906 RepID=UPI0036A573FD
MAWPECLICFAADLSRARAHVMASVVSVRNACDIIRQHPHRRATDEGVEE